MIKTQIGGKGTMRKKQHKKKLHIDKDEDKFKKYIDSINQKILSLNSKNYIEFRNVLETLLTQYFKDLKRVDINKSSGLRYADINIKGISFIYKELFYPVDETKILLKSNTYPFIIRSFKSNGKNLFFKLIDSIDNLLVKKEYKTNIHSIKYDEDEFNRALLHFGIDPIGKVHFKEIRQKYNEFTSKNQQIENSNLYFTLLQNQYSDYLKRI